MFTKEQLEIFKNRVRELTQPGDIVTLWTVVPNPRGEVSDDFEYICMAYRDEFLDAYIDGVYLYSQHIRGSWSKTPTITRDKVNVSGVLGVAIEIGLPELTRQLSHPPRCADAWIDADMELREFPPDDNDYRDYLKRSTFPERTDVNSIFLDQ